MKLGTRTGTIEALIAMLALFTTGQAHASQLADTTTQSGISEEAKNAGTDRENMAAIVNGVQISEGTVNELMKRLGTEDQESNPQLRNDVRKRALNQLVLEELATQEAARQNINVKKTDLDKAMKRAISNLGHEDGYRAFLEEQRLTEPEFRAQIERYLLLQHLLSKEVTSKVAIADKDIRAEYERIKEEFVTPEKIGIVDVVFFLNYDDPASIKKVEETLAKIKADKDKNPHNVSDHDGEFVIRDLDPLAKEKEPVLYEAARKLKQGDLSGVIKTGDSLHIVQLTTYSPEQKKSYEEVKGLVGSKLKAAALKKRRIEWEQELKEKAKIELINSTDPK